MHLPRVTPVPLLVVIAVLMLPAVAQAAAPAQGVSAMALDGRIELAWQPAAGASGYAVYRGTTATSITTRVTPLGGQLGTSFVDTGAVNGTTYFYTVRSIESGFESADSLVVQATAAATACSS